MYVSFDDSSLVPCGEIKLKRFLLRGKKALYLLSSRVSLTCFRCISTCMHANLDGGRNYQTEKLKLFFDLNPRSAHTCDRDCLWFRRHLMTLFVFVRYDHFLLPRAGLSFQETFTATLDEWAFWFSLLMAFKKPKKLSVFLVWTITFSSHCLYHYTTLSYIHLYMDLF
jgi:hypothetical protein